MESPPVAIATAVSLLGEHLAAAEEEDAQVRLDRTVTSNRGNVYVREYIEVRAYREAPSPYGKGFSFCLFTHTFGKLMDRSGQFMGAIPLFGPRTWVLLNVVAPSI